MMNGPLQIARRSQYDDDSISTVDSSDQIKLGDTIVKATNFLGNIVKGNHRRSTFDGDFNNDVDRYRRSVNSADEDKGIDNSAISRAHSDHYNAVNDGNLYQCLRSVRHTGGGMNMEGGGTGPELNPDELSFSSHSEMSMPKIEEGYSDDESTRSRGESIIEGGNDDNHKPVRFVPNRELPPRQTSDLSMYSTSGYQSRRGSDYSTNNNNNRRGSNESEGSTIQRRNRLIRQSSDLFSSSSRKERSDSPSCSSGVSGPLGRGKGLLRTMGESSKNIFSGGRSQSSNGERRSSAGRERHDSATRRSSAMSIASDGSGDNKNHGMSRWMGMGSSFVVRKDSNIDTKKLMEESNGLNSSFNNGHARTTSAPLPQVISSGMSVTSGVSAMTDMSFADHHAKSRSRFVQRNVSNATMDKESFRVLQQRIRNGGAVTGNAVVHMLQEAAEEHAVHENEGGYRDHDEFNASIDLSRSGSLNENELFKNSVQRHHNHPQSHLPSSRFMNSSNNSGNFDNSSSSFDHSDGINAKRYLRRTYTQHEEQKLLEMEAQQERLEQDPMFGSKDGTNRPYISVPSREPKVEQLLEVLHSAADEGRSCLCTVHGPKFVGKSKLIRKVIDTVQIQGLGCTVLESSRTDNDALTSYYSFRTIVEMALRACDAVTQRDDSNGGETVSSSEDEENVEKIVHRLVERKILNKSDQLMIGRILPSVMNKQLLSLLKGRNPTALTKDIVASLFKIMIPLQPVVLVFEHQGDGCDIDQSSLDLMEELLLSSGKQCPQMLLMAVSRHPLTIPASIAEKHHVDVEIEPMSNDDTESYIRALFCDPNCIDRNMRVDEEVVDGIYDRAHGCPLLTERIVLWSQREDVIEIDETRNSVALNVHCHANSNVSREELLDTLPVNLNEDILGVINNLPHHLLDALKTAACIGVSFDIGKYSQLKNEQGFYNSLQEVMTSHGIFDESKGCFKWRHVAVFEAVESIIISNERIEIQGRIADSIRDLPSDGQYVKHYVMAERWDKAFDQYMEAGKKAEQNLDFVGAVGMYQQAKICSTKSPTKPTLRRKLAPHAALGWCLRELVRYEEAESELEFCLKQTMAVPERRQNAQFKEIELDVVTTLATLKQAQSKYPQALELYDRALPIARANKESHSQVWLAHHVSSCAEIHRKSGDLEEAKTLHTEALGYRELAVEEGTCTTLDLSLSFTQLGCTLSGLGDHSKAFNLHKKALAVRVEHLDFYHSLVSESLNYCADALQALGRGCEGIPLGLHAVKIRKFVFGPLHPAYAHALSVLASCYHSVGRSFDSLGLLKECLDICEKFFSKNHANMIPNLMLYGSVLTVSGKYDQARDTYERALSIHKLNFKEGQNAPQLVKLEKAMGELSSSANQQAKASLEMPIPSFEPDCSKTHVIVCADIGHRASDEYMLSVAASLEKMGTMKLMAFIAVSSPQVVRADIARGALDSLLLSNVPVAYSGVVSSSGNKAASAATFNADYGKSSPHVNNTGVELITRTLFKAADKSLVIMCTACLGDVSEVIDTHKDLFAKKVKQVIVLGSVKAMKRRSTLIEPEASGCDKDDEFAWNVYQSCQDLQIPTVTLSKDLTRGFPFPSSHVDDLTLTNHMVSTKTKLSEEMHMNGIWELMKQLKQESKSYLAPKNLDVKEFNKYVLGGQNPPISQHNIWPLIRSINLELTLGLLSCIPVYQDAHFKWETHQINGIEHKICRHSSATAGVIEPETLSNEIHMLVGFAFRTSLLNTSC